jgi:RHS repeat-associated protein
VLLLVFALLVLLTAARAQDTAAGILPFSTQATGLYDSIDLANSNIFVQIPIRTKVGKIPFSYSLVMNAHVSKPATVNTTILVSTGLSGQLGAGGTTLYVVSQQVTGRCDGGYFLMQGQLVTAGYVLDSTGAYHSAWTSLWFLPDAPGHNCPDPPPSFPITYKTTDGTGYTVVLTGNNGGALGYNLYDKSGNYFPQSLTTVIQDPDGVALTKSAGTFTDTLGSSALTVTKGFSGNPDKYQYTDVNGYTQTFQVNYSSYNQQTTFACTGTTDLSGAQVYLPSSVSTPTGNFQLYYEPTPGHPSNVTGRIAKIVFPTGGYVSYSYTGGVNNVGLNCHSYVVPALTRTLYDNVSNSTYAWTYVNENTSSTPGNFTVIETDPGSSQTVFNFAGEYQTEKISFQGGCSGYTGCNGGGTKLRDVTTCYNGNLNGGLGACQTPSSVPAFPLTQTDVYTWSGMTGQSLLERTFNSYGDITKVASYDWGAPIPPSGTPLSSTTITYDGVNGASCGSLSGYIYDRPCAVTTTGSGVTSSQTTFAYNSTGHATATSQLVSGTTYLTSQASYNVNGTIATSTDVNGTVTNTYYNGTGGCNGILPTSTVVGGLTISLQWKCDGGVETKVTDANNNSTPYAYLNQSGTADPLWRLLSTTDPLGNVTWNTYTAATPSTQATAETYLNFPNPNPTSTVDVLATLDGLGRLTQTQRRTAPNAPTFDQAVGYGYGWNTTGPVTTQTVPGGAAVTTAQMDALARNISVTDGGGGTLTLGYPKNDVLSTLGPPPTGEHTKGRQLQYDGAGRLISACEILSSGGSSCLQSTSASGYLTTYAYSVPSVGISKTAVTQGVQTRNYTYDGLGRLTSEMNPESGTTTYTYDNDSSGGCPGTYNGDLVKRVDNAGNKTCYAYDGLHRELSATYTGPNATTNRYFVYDAVSVNGQSMANAKGQLAEAYTATCQTCSKVTDEGFGYTVRGELSDFYESTLHSGGYYHIPMTYWANGLVESFGPFLTEDQMGFIPDGEGRPYSLYDFPHQDTSTLNSTSYSAGGLPTTLVTSCINGNTCYPISYQYDPNTLRMTQYGAALNNGTISGTLTWNPNGSVQQLVIADPFNSADAQTCTYSADDLGRIASTSCGSTWAQTFSYDAYGNVSKSGSVSWLPGYNASTNQYALGGTSYDANGNVLKDSFNIYTWDAEGKQLSTAYNNGGGQTWAFTYDAFGHMVELSVNGAYEYSYIDIGKYKLSAIGQTAAYSEVPLPGGSVYSQNGGATGIQLADWLGTIRAFYSLSGGYSNSGAHAPFGEAYGYQGGYPAGFAGQGGIGWGQGDDGSMNNTTYYFPERQYRSSQGRWLSPDPSGLAAVDPANPQSWNRYAYVLNNPLSLIDPTGLDCVFLNDAGTSGEEIEKDNDPSIGESGLSASDWCGGQGGYYIPGSIPDLSYVSVNADNGLVSAYSNAWGYPAWSVAGAAGSNPWGAWTQTFGFNGPTASDTLYLPANDKDPMAPSARRMLLAIANAAPTVCGGGAFVFAGREVSGGPVHAFAGAITTFDSQNGTTTGALFEAGGGEGLMGGGGVEVVPNGNGGLGSEGLLFGGFGVSSPIASASAGVVGFTSGGGFYVEGSLFGRAVGGGIYANVTTNAGCKKKG